MPQSLKLHRAIALTVLALAAAALTGGCGPTLVKADYQMPKPLITPVTARVGLILDDELRGYHHQETRAGTEWDIQLGEATAKMWEDVFKVAFTEARVFGSLEEAIAASSGLQALAQPRIEQYSFATGRETVGGHWASTLRLRLGVFSPTGQPVDSLTMNGYGNSYGNGGSKKSLGFATRSALRDASAKFLVQMPRQPIAARLSAGDVIDAPTAPMLTADAIEAVPIDPVQAVRPAP
jgi:hypothetical protein